MVTCLQLAMPAASLSSLPNQTNRRWRCKPLCAANIPMPPQNPKDPFLARLASIARSKPNLKPKLDLKLPPFLDVYQSPNMVGGSVEGEEEETQEAGVDDRKNPPPDLPSSLLDGRIVFIGLPLFPEVTDLVIAQLIYLQKHKPRQPIYIYLNSSGITDDDGEMLGTEYDGLAVYDAMMMMKCPVYTVAFGEATGQACLLLAAGTKGCRFMYPGSIASIYSHCYPSTELEQASDIAIEAKERLWNRNLFAKLFAYHTGNSIKTVKYMLDTGFYLDPVKAKRFGVIDKIIWKGQVDLEKLSEKRGFFDKDYGLIDTVNISSDKPMYPI